MVVEFLRNHHSADLTIRELVKKVVTLMALANSDKCSDLAALDRDYLKWTPSGIQFPVVQLTKIHTTGPPRIVYYSSLPDDVEAFLVAALCLYSRLRLRLNIRSIRKIFLTFKISLELHANYLHLTFAG